MKHMNIESNITMDATIQELQKYMDFLEIPREDWRMAALDYPDGAVGLAFQLEGVHYLISSRKQTYKKQRPSISRNARVILHIIQARVREMRKGAETRETAFDGFINWKTTQIIPRHIDEQLQTRGVSLMLPAPKNNQHQLEDKP
jgi:hypothetical protein